MFSATVTMSRQLMGNQCADIHCLVWSSVEQVPNWHWHTLYWFSTLHPQFPVNCSEISWDRVFMSAVYLIVDMYREWKKIEFPKEYCIWIWKQQDQEVDQETDGWMKWGRMEEWSVERSGRKKCMTGRNGRGSWERQGITAFCTCQWIDWLFIW